MAITTKTGDSGQTSLFGGSRVDKDHQRIESNGLVDELNARIGMLLAELPENNEWEKRLLGIQRDLMLMMSHIATPAHCEKPNKKPHPEKGLLECEHWIIELTDYMSDEKLAFVLPGGNKISALCHLARTAARSAERALVTLNKIELVASYILSYLNRLSDLFYLLAVAELKSSGVKAEKFMLFPSQK